MCVKYMVSERAKRKVTFRMSENHVMRYEGRTGRGEVKEIHGG